MSCDHTLTIQRHFIYHRLSFNCSSVIDNVKALLQRVSQASVHINKQRFSGIQHGLLIFLGIERNDQQTQVDKLLSKVLGFRIFSDSEGKMNLNVQQAEGELLIVPQFTLAADTQHGLRPSFSTAAEPFHSKKLFEEFVEKAIQRYPNISTGVFGADMQVHLINDGPVTFNLSS